MIQKDSLISASSCQPVLGKTGDCSSGYMIGARIAALCGDLDPCRNNVGCPHQNNMLGGELITREMGSYSQKKVKGILGTESYHMATCMLDSFWMQCEK